MLWVLLGTCLSAECQDTGSSGPTPTAPPSNDTDPAASKPVVSPQGISDALDIEAEVVPLTDAIREAWIKVIDAACSNVNPLPRANPERWERRDVVAVLRAIDSTLIRHGFVYPDTGAVDLMAHALSPFEMPPGRRPAFEELPHNQRRKAMIAERFPGPFFNLDCDTACLLYLAAALASAGRFDEAVKQVRAAIRSSGDDALARQGYRQRLRLYELRKPFQTPAGNPAP